MTRSDDTRLSRYISMANAITPLERDEEVRLVEAWQRHGDVRARSALLAAQLRYVVVIALKYRRYRVSLDDLIAEGNLGAVHALSKFDSNRGLRFVTYASYWIRAYMLNHIIQSWSLVGGSSAMRSKVFFKLRRERIRLVNLVGDGDQANVLLAQSMNLPLSKVVSMVRRLEARDVSLDAKVRDDSDATLLDLLESPVENPEQAVANDEEALKLREAVESAVRVLDERERYIVDHRLMADSEDELSLAEIGRRLGVSRERARQLETRTRGKIRAGLVAELGMSA
jgi:RNA polymerase sigma-32 factor